MSCLVNVYYTHISIYSASRSILSEANTPIWHYIMSTCQDKWIVLPLHALGKASLKHFVCGREHNP